MDGHANSNKFGHGPDLPESRLYYDNETIEGKHSDFVAWADWFVKEQVRRGATKPNADFIGSVLCTFLDSGKAYLAQKEALVDCPKCDGRGHSNLFLLGSDKPAPCAKCGGDGRVPAMGVSE